MSDSPNNLIGIDVGGTEVKAVLVDRAGRVIARRAVPTGDATDSWKPAVRQIVSDLEQSNGPVERVGVCCPGIARPDGSGISWMIGRMTSVVDFDFTAHLRRRERVFVLNDGLAALLGEVWVGAGAGLRDVVMYTLGTGVGGAIYADGRLLKGHTGRAGHLGHLSIDHTGPLDICNTPGSIEHHVGDYSLSARTQGRYRSTRDLVEAVSSGDPQARQIWTAMIDQLAAAIVSVVNAVDPQRIIIGGGIAKAGPVLFDALRLSMDRVEWRPLGSGVEVVPAQLGEWAGAIGAARNGQLSSLTIEQH